MLFWNIRMIKVLVESYLNDLYMYYNQKDLT